MGTYVNPDNAGFWEMLNSGNYRDKTGLISYINSVLSNKVMKETIFTRPRRFGKTIACDMLAAYYSIGCDSRDLFKGLRIEKDPTFEAHLNKHPVIYFDLYPFMHEWKKGNLGEQTMVQYMEQILVEELSGEYPFVDIKDNSSLANAMIAVSKYLKAKKQEEKTKKQEEKAKDTHKFIVIIDEWDMVLREAKDEPRVIEEYIDFLRSIFRSKDTSIYLAGAYMTGILPIIRYNTQSALSDFKERTMLKPLMLAEYVGFTREDVHAVCERLGADEGLMKVWYDGYNLPGAGEVYCPASVMAAATENDYSGHWPKTSAMEALTDYIYMDIDGLQETMDRLLDGKEEDIDPDVFENRLDKVETRDDVLTVLVHLGYLAYDYTEGTVRVPNLEVRQQMLQAFKKAPNELFIKRFTRCEKTLKAVKEMDSQTVAAMLKEFHGERPPIHYNDEQALRYVVLMGFNNSPRGRYTSFEEFSSGKGFVDILFKPLKGCGEPPILVELRHGASSGKAISQIHDKDYIDYLKKDEYSGTVLLCGVNYSPDTREHTCRIEKIVI